MSHFCQKCKTGGGGVVTDFVSKIKRVEKSPDLKKTSRCRRLDMAGDLLSNFYLSGSAE